jgi:hypothetical protein
MFSRSQLALLLLLLIPCWVIAVHYDIDLPTLYHAMSNADSGKLSEVYAETAGQVEITPGHEFLVGRYFYPPFSLVFFSPAGLVPYPIIKWSWFALQTLWFGLFWILLGKLYPEVRSGRLDWLWIAVWIVSINPIHNNFQSNNIQLLLAAFLFGSELLSQRENRFAHIVAGMFLSFAIGLKVYPLFLVGYYAAVKSRWVNLGVLLGGVLVIFSPLALYGVSGTLELYRGFYQNVTTYGRDNGLLTVVDINSLPSMLARFTQPWLHPEQSARLTQVITVILSLGYFGFSALVKRFSPDFKRLEIHLWALGLALMIFLNPSTRPHYYLFYVPAFVSLGHFIKSSKPRLDLVASFVGAVLLIAFTAEGVVGKTINDEWEAWSIPTIGMLLLCVALFVAIRRRVKLTPIF